MMNLKEFVPASALRFYPLTDSAQSHHLTKSFVPNWFAFEFIYLLLKLRKI